MQWVAPLANASAHFSSDPAVPIRVKPLAAAHWQASKPTPPAAAWNNTVSPACKGVVCSNKYWVVKPLSIIAAACSKEILSGKGQT